MPSQQSGASCTLPVGTLVLVVFAASLVSACTVEFEEDFDTSFRVPSPEGERARPLWRAKRFKLKKDPNDAENVEFLEASIEVKQPKGSDLTFINSVEVYACSDIEIDKCNGLEPQADLTLLAVGENFEPGQSWKRLNIKYGGDLRGFVKDHRVVLTFVVYPTAWGYDWPDEGVLVRTDVTLLITASPL